MSEIKLELDEDLEQDILEEVKKREDLTATTKDQLKKQLKEAEDAAEAARKAATDARKKAREAKKEFKRLKEEQGLDHSIDIWRQITKIREDAEQAIQDLIEKEKGNITGLTKNKVKGDFNRYYTYQHPGKNQGNLRSNNQDETWIADYIKENPKTGLADLIHKADTTRAKSFIASFKRSRKASKDTSEKKTTKESAIDPNKRDQ